MFDEKTLELRRGGIGASETPCLFAECVNTRKYMTPITLYQKKLGIYNEPEEESLAAMMGIYLEPMVAERFAKKFKVELVDPHDVWPETNGILVHPEIPWMMATLDRWVDGSYQPVQIKNLDSSRREEFGEDGEERLPIDYRIQCVKELGILRAYLESNGHPKDKLPELAYLAVQFTDRAKTFITLIVPWDEQLWAAIKAADEQMWVDHIMPQIPPPPDETEDYTDFLVEQTDMASEEVVEVADEETNMAAAAYLHAKEVIKQAEDIAKKAKQKLVVAAQGRRYLRGAFGKMTIVGGRETPKTDWEGVAMAMKAPLEVIQQFTDVKTTATYPRVTPDKKWLESLPTRVVTLIEGPHE